jgi:hypothetical protein
MEACAKEERLPVGCSLVACDPLVERRVVTCPGFVGEHKAKLRKKDYLSNPLADDGRNNIALFSLLPAALQDAASAVGVDKAVQPVLLSSVRHY